MLDKIKNKVTSIFKKPKEDEETPPIPNLMGEDPVSSSSVNLMASDPINSLPVAKASEIEHEFKEQQGIEKQLTSSTIPRSDKPIAIIVQEQETKPIEKASEISAFSMPVPIPTSQSTPIETLETLDIFDEPIERTQKICICGTPNDPLAKFCVSCGKTYD